MISMTRDTPITDLQKDENQEIESTAKELRRILLVDDEEDIANAFASILESSGYEVDAVSDGETAIEIFVDRRHDVVLTDLMMPGMDGIQLLRRIREHDLHVPVVIVTAAPSLETAIHALEYGALRYVLKPIRQSELKRVVKEALHLSTLAKLKREALAIAGNANAAAGDQAGLEAVFERALKCLFLVYQPIIRWSDKSVFGYEALLRSCEEALPHPGALFDAAERLNRTNDLGRAVRVMGPQPMFSRKNGEFLLINLHTADLIDEDLYSTKSRLSAMADRSILEITERSTLDGLKDVRTRIKQLRDLGFRIAVDDLGAGYAGLSSFSLLEPEVVKLDMTLIRDIHLMPTKQKLVASMVSLCRDMEVELIVEGVETVEERDALIALGSDLFQGYLFARPGPPFPDVQW